jgi:hypothetical protein
VSKYLNRKDVQQALHANLVGVDDWSTCSGLVLLLIYFCCYKKWVKLITLKCGSIL